MFSNIAIYILIPLEHIQRVTCYERMY